MTDLYADLHQQAVKIIRNEPGIPQDDGGYDPYYDQPTSPTAAPAGSDLFRRWTMPELLAEPDEFAWLVQGMLADPTYGQIAGEMKSLKTYLTAMIQVGVAGGVPILGRFTPPAARPVVSYLGEGGRQPYLRRLKRISDAMGVTLSDLPLYLVADIAPVNSPVFQESLARDLDEIHPGLLTVDPLYAYHGTSTSAANLHEEGALLGAMASPCTQADCTLLVANHLNQTGSGLNLKRITMAGSGEWVDSWLLVAHRANPDVDRGLFYLTLQIGSRQWGGTTWDVDLDIGRFDADTGTHDGTITWDLTRSTGDTAVEDRQPDQRVQEAKHRILEVLTDCPWRYTKTEVRGLVGGSSRVFNPAFDELVADDRISHTNVGRQEADMTRRRTLWGLQPVVAE